MLRLLDFDVAWSGRNYSILYEAKLCPNAPPIDYTYEFDLGGDPSWPNGTPEMWAKNLHMLQTLKALAGPISTVLVRPAISPAPYLKTDPPIDFIPSFKDNKDGDIVIKSGFLTLTAWRHRGNNSFNTFFSASDSYRSLYQHSKCFRSLPNDAKRREELKITPEQLKQLEELLHQFAIKLCASRFIDNKASNLYQGLVFVNNYNVPFDDDWFFLESNYFEAPAGSIHDQAEADLMNAFQTFSQNYHAGTVEFVESAKKIFTPSQLEEILR